ncbi:PIN domain-containing protein [Candidatus Pacearchaeota archaeon]|nr:PIN domain-containing protein [Candidatus Pacearchaeota archaeon]
MIFLDSWIWIEYFSDGEKLKESTEILEDITIEQGGVISTMVLTEVKYRIAKKFDVTKADWVITLIENFSNIKIIPVTKEIAKLSANLRLKYCNKTRNISYGGCINLATALLTSCKTFYSGDPDFKGIEEIKTVIV